MRPGELRDVVPDGARRSVAGEELAAHRAGVPLDGVLEVEQVGQDPVGCGRGGDGALDGGHQELLWLRRAMAAVRAVVARPIPAAAAAVAAVRCTVRRQRSGSTERRAARTASSNPVGPPGGGPIAAERVVLVADRVVDEAAHQGAGDTRGDRRDEADPQPGQPGSEHRDRHDEAAPDTRGLRIALHHLGVGQDLGTSDVEGPVGRGRQVGRAHEVVDDVVHGDRLDLVVDPPGRDHGRQPFGEVAQHVEGRGAVAEHDPGLQHRGRHGRVEEDLADLHAGGQVLGQVAAGVQPAEVDDPARCPRRPRLPRNPAPSCGRVATKLALSVHRVQQVVGHLDPVERATEVVGGGGVTLDHLHVVGPGPSLEAGAAAGEDPHRPARRRAGPGRGPHRCSRWRR